MTGIETQVLRIIQELGLAEPSSLARKIGVSEAYVSDNCKNLVEDGYLIVRKNGKFKLSGKAKQELSPIKSRGPIAILKGGIW